MATTHLAITTEICLNEERAVKRLSALIYFLRGEISLNELRIKMGKLLPIKLVGLCGNSVNGYLPKLTQAGLGEKLGCTYAAVQTWEKGKKPSFPRLTTFLKIAKFCDLTINELTELLFDFSDEAVNFENLESFESHESFEELLDFLIKKR